MSATTTLEPREKSRTSLAPRWHVILLDDDEHTYEYVVEMLGAVFGHSVPRAFEMAQEVDATGRVIVWTGGRAVAERKREEVHAYGADPRIPRCKGAMTAILEAVDG